MNRLTAISTLLISLCSISCFAQIKRTTKTNNDPKGKWIATSYKTGDVPKCLNTPQEFDSNMDNFLKITNKNSSTNAVVKLIRLDTPNKKEVTYRIAFIKAGDIYTMLNIPAGKYYTKIAYGTEWKQLVDKRGECVCQCKFTKNAQYEKGGNIIDFYPIRTSIGTDIPNYQLTLDAENANDGYFHDFGEEGKIPNTPTP